MKIGFTVGLMMGTVATFAVLEKNKVTKMFKKIKAKV